MNIWILFLVLIAFVIVEFVTGFFFNYKIQLITEKKYNWAAFYGAISTFLFTTATIFTAFIAVGGEEEGELWWFILLAAFAMSIGNYLAALMVPIIRKYFENRKKNNIKKGDNI